MSQQHDDNHDQAAAGLTATALRAKLAAHASWANTRDPLARTEPARQAAARRFEQEARAILGEDATEDEIQRTAGHLRKAHYYRMALKSHESRRNRSRARKAAGEAGK